MHLIRCILNFDKRHAESMRKPPAFNSRVSVGIRVLFRVACRVTVCLFKNYRKKDTS